jgi:hypothetical protein
VQGLADGDAVATAEQAGAKSQVTGLVGAGHHAHPAVLPRAAAQPTLAAVVIAASLSLADLPVTLTSASISMS